MVDTRSASGAKSLAAALNAQRERRSSVSAVDDINRTLAELESQIALLEGETTQPANEASQRKYPESAIAGLEAIAEQLRRLSDPLTVAEPDTVSAPATASGSVAERLAQMRTSASQPTGLKSNDDRLGSIDAQLKQLDAHFASAPQRSDLQSFVQSDALFQRLGELSRRIDALHANSAMQGQTVERLAGQLEKLARYVGRIAEELDAADFQQIETRLVTFADKLDALEKRTSDHQQAFQAQIDQRFLELTKRLDAHHAAHKTAYDKVEKFENELADNPAIRNLEKQITALSDLFARPAPETVALETRLASIEKTLVDNRDVVIEAARLAAEQAVKHFAENADHNTARTFASIQDNLTTITERLARLEKGSSAPASSVTPNPGVTPFRVPPADTVSIDNAAKRSSYIEEVTKALHVFRAETAKKTEHSETKSPYHQHDNVMAFAPKHIELDGNQTRIAPPADRPETDSVLNLNAIMKRLRGDRHNPIRAPISKPDIISAARKEAQRKAAEAESDSALSNAEKAQKAASISDIVNRHSKPLLFTLALFTAALSAIQLGMEPTAGDIATMQEPALDTNITAGIPEEPAVLPKALASIPHLPDEAGPQALRKAAAKGDVRALFEVGNRYFEGRNGKVDYDTATKWYLIAAMRGSAPAQFRLGNIYDKGLIGPRDAQMAEDWYLQAAEQGNVNAMHHLAVLYAAGVKGEPNNAEAVRWFRQAADYGIKDSQYNLGVLAARGLGMPADYQESYHWFSLAAQSGDKEAAEKRDLVAKGLSAEQRKKADHAINSWQAKPINETANATDTPTAWATDALPDPMTVADNNKAL